MDEGLKELASMRPIDYALNMLTINITTGIFLGLPIAALMQRKRQILRLISKLLNMSNCKLNGYLSSYTFI